MIRSASTSGHRLFRRRRPSCGTRVGAADQAGQDARLVAEAVEERVDHQVAVGAGQAPHSAQARATASDCRCAVIAPLLRPVVPEVNRMSLTSSGLTAAARSRAAAAGTQAARSRKTAQPMAAPAGALRAPARLAPLARPPPGWPRRGSAPPGRAGPGWGRPGLVQRLGFVRGGGAEGGEPVGAEERAGDEQGAGAAAADHVERLVAGEPGADRDQRRAGVERAERREHPVMGVGRPDGDPVPGGDALGDERPGGTSPPARAARGS